MQRLMLTPAFLFGLRVGVPLALMLGAAAWWLSDLETQMKIRDAVAEARTSIEEHPKFMVNMMAIDGADSELANDIRIAVPLDFPVSSFDLDPSSIRDTILAMPPVKEATVRIRPGGVLQVDVTPRVPVAIWRTPEGLTLVDSGGATVAPIARRGLRPDLPVIAGLGAPQYVEEALSLVRAAAPLGDRLRGLVRMGERRWDVVLNRGQRILLPQGDAVRALERVVALESAQEVLTRDVARVDLRLPDRPTVRMTPAATDEWWRIRQLNIVNE